MERQRQNVIDQVPFRRDLDYQAKPVNLEKVQQKEKS